MSKLNRKQTIPEAFLGAVLTPRF